MKENGMINNKKLLRMKELTEILRAASKAYYAQDKEIMSNFEYDRLYDELVGLEQETGMVLTGSPTVNVGYEAVDELPKEAHESPMLSLGKTKDREELKKWIGDKEGMLSWKLDGLTIVLTYHNGELRKRYGWGSDHEQCEGVQKHSAAYPVSGKSDPQGRGSHHV